MFDFFLKIYKNRTNKAKNTPPHYKLQHVLRYAGHYKEAMYQNIYLVTYNLPGVDEHTRQFSIVKDHLLLIYGNVQWRIGGDLNLKHIKFSAPTLEEIFDLFQHYPADFYKFIKGNYTIVICSLKKNNVKLISAPFCTLPTYYYQNEDTVYISSNLSMILVDSDRKFNLNYQSLVEFAIFDYILGDKTILEDIFQIESGEIVQINNGCVSKRTYYMKDKTLLNLKYSNRTTDVMNTIGKLLQSAVISYITQTKRTNLALTGGLDGRLLLALIDPSHYDKIVCYSYGLPGSLQIRIPLEIERRLGIKYVPVYFDKHYEETFSQNGLEAIILSDGYAPFMRANYLYAHKKLTKYSRHLIMGLFGSEILRPIHSTGGVALTTNLMNIFLQIDHTKSFYDIFHRTRKEKYLIENIFTDDIANNIINFLNKFYFDRMQLDPRRRLYIFLFNEGLRKFFMEELRIDRYFMDYFLPYLDLDFVEYVHKTPFAAVYQKGIFEENPLKRRTGQFIYAYLINQYNPVLSTIILDRGYKPKDLLHKWRTPFVAYGFIKWKVIRKKFIPDDTFDAPRWANIMFSQNIKFIKEADPIFGKNLWLKYCTGSYKNDLYKFSRYFSLKCWINYFSRYIKF